MTATPTLDFSPEINSVEAAAHAPRPIRAYLTLDLTTTGRAACWYQAKRRLVRIQNAGSTSILLGTAVGNVATEPGAYGTTILVGQEYVGYFDPNPVWLKVGSGSGTALVIIEEEI